MAPLLTSVTSGALYAVVRALVCVTGIYYSAPPCQVPRVYVRSYTVSVTVDQSYTRNVVKPRRYNAMCTAFCRYIDTSRCARMHNALHAHYRPVCVSVSDTCPPC